MSMSKVTLKGDDVKVTIPCMLRVSVSRYDGDHPSYVTDQPSRNVTGLSIMSKSRQGQVLVNSFTTIPVPLRQRKRTLRTTCSTPVLQYAQRVALLPIDTPEDWNHSPGSRVTAITLDTLVPK